jgi:MraZ protein
MVHFGEFRGKIDKQGRILIPAKLRSQLAQVMGNRPGSLFITKGLENCLFIFSEKIWENQSEKLRELPFTKGDPRTFTRLFFSSAFQADMDKQGRLSIPLNLIQHAQIKENIVLIGVDTRIEIWDEEKWDKYYTNALKTYETISEKLTETL